MIIIKIYSQDLFVASEVSVDHADKIGALLNISRNDVLFIGSEGVLVAEGIEQISWFTYLEVSLDEAYREHQNELSTLLHEIFANYGVHILIKYDYIHKTDVVKILNPDFKVFNEMIVDVTPSSYYEGDEDDDDEDDPWDPLN